MEFVLPETLAEASARLLESPGARCLAGGANLVQAMNDRSATPDAIVSLAAIPELRGLAVGKDSSLRVGAMTTHRELATTTSLSGDHRLLAAAAVRIGNPAIRNMGTIGGSVAFGDPAADYLAPLRLLDPLLELFGSKGARSVGIGDFLLSPFTTDLRRGEILVALRFSPSRLARVHYERLSRTQGDGAIASVAVALEIAEGRPGLLRVATAGCGPRPEQGAASGGSPEECRALRDALVDASEPWTDLRASAGYRKLVLPRLIDRAMAQVLGQAPQ